MKRVTLLLGLSMMLSISFAQNFERTSAYNYNRDGKLDKAKESIDKAAAHEKTMNDAKTWLYKGLIYYNIAQSPLPAYSGLDSNAAKVSYEAFLKAKELDVKGKLKKDIESNLKNLVNVFYIEGGKKFQQKEYMAAIGDFENAFNIAQSAGKFDTIAAFNIGMAGVMSKNPEIAAEYLQKCIDVDFADPRVYMFYNRSAKQLGDTAKAIEILNMGRERFPNELSLLLEQAQLYLEKGETELLQKSLLAAIEKDPTNSNLFFLLGKTYDDTKDFENAELYYKKASEVNPDFFEAYYNLGAIYVNKAAELQSEASELPLDKMKEYDALNAEADTNLEKALPYLEKSFEINPDDIYTKNALKEAYIRLKMNDKLEELNNK
ncbi:MAG: tetratricopeptide repeat protein [Chlorobi bacterium]|nr:tetratricopeptide repeat protein [Chlorobiota bacterium]